MQHTPIFDSRSTNATYTAYLKSSWWKHRRSRSLQLANNTCVKCGWKDRLHVHHLTYVRIGKERDSDLQVLCEYCHLTAHGQNGETIRKKHVSKKITSAKPKAFWMKYTLPLKINPDEIQIQLKGNRTVSLSDILKMQPQDVSKYRLNKYMTGKKKNRRLKVTLLLRERARTAWSPRAVREATRKKTNNLGSWKTRFPCSD